jgi:protein TonB
MTPPTRTDLVFESRNKAYGAYTLIKAYPDRVLQAVVLTSLLFSLIMSEPIWISWFSNPELVDEKLVLSQPTLIQPPPIDPKIPPPPPLPVASIPPPKVSTVRFIPPEVAKDEEVIEEDPPKQEELKQAVAAAETKEGDPNADPAILDLDQVGTGDGAAQIVAPVEEEVFSSVEEMPEFLGGNLHTFIAENIQYPQRALRAEVEGLVYTSFVVGVDGSISDFKIMRGIGFGCDEEALRVIQKLDKWKPGRMNGYPVKVRVPIAVKFRLKRTP